MRALLPVEMRHGRFNALVACALMSGVAVAQGAVAERASRAAPPVATVQSVTTAPLLPIESCVSRLDPQLDIGYNRIAARCPELVKQLDRGAWAPWLPRDWKESGNDLSAGGLNELRELVNRETAASVSSRAPDVRHLRSVLAALGGTGDESRWSRFKSWLHSILEAREQPPDESWFTHMVGHIGFSQSLRQLIAYTSLIVVVLLAGAIVVNEARAVGILPKRGGMALKARASSQTSTPLMSRSEIERASPADQPRLLLELVVRLLTERGYLPPAGGMTVRELTTAARLPEVDDRERLADLALAAERVRYSARDPHCAGLDGPVARGRELLDRLDASTQG